MVHNRLGRNHYARCARGNHQMTAKPGSSINFYVCSQKDALKLGQPKRWVKEKGVVPISVIYYSKLCCHYGHDLFGYFHISFVMIVPTQVLTGPLLMRLKCIYETEWFSDCCVMFAARSQEMADENRLNLVAMKSCLLSPSVNQPVVFHGLISSWPAMQWSPLQLTNIFTDQTFKFRLGRKYSDGKHCHQCFSHMN